MANPVEDPISLSVEHFGEGRIIVRTERGLALPRPFRHLGAQTPLEKALQGVYSRYSGQDLSLKNDFERRPLIEHWDDPRTVISHTYYDISYLAVAFV